ncbi:hypothetical protein DICPUDRAFT_30479 [Dictyostelium purpureum]|uniref:COMM domain-containing protein n=1 Tax=Dictyostelium purpureum TaxID=5786 RepID=F0ZFG4_DICPU|nr:uncharacterized protein DICPUDRAFT_30479 [Dictyostelium purpureum]EGC37334.1 hypothetical protein DICPUDRAFT_30479 [Dictyostelium purpureum]|eukprot:XP_003286148.1 hypothetical protein DICPUDRAFT_30479 [Dictyostelium purpureum]
MTDNNIFGNTKKFNDSIDIINKLETPRFQKILIRVLNKNERIFTEQEEGILQNIFKLTSSEFKGVLECCSFIFEQTAYYSLSPNNLLNQLKKTNLDDDKASSFQSTWEDNSDEVLGYLRTQSISPLQLDEIGWRLHYQMSSSTAIKRQASAILSLDFKSDTSNNNNNSNKKNNMILEFNKEQLLDFYNKLETIQEKLDSLA